MSIKPESKRYIDIEKSKHMMRQMAYFSRYKSLISDLKDIDTTNIVYAIFKRAKEIDALDVLTTIVTENKDSMNILKNNIIELLQYFEDIRDVKNLNNRIEFFSHNKVKVKFVIYFKNYKQYFRSFQGFKRDITISYCNRFLKNNKRRIKIDDELKLRSMDINSRCNFLRVDFNTYDKTVEYDEFKKIFR